MLFLILIFTIAIFYEPVNLFLIKIYEGIFSEVKGYGIISKLTRLPIAYKYFLDRPIFGHGSPNYAYSVLMGTDDIPAIVIYFLAEVAFWG